MIIRDRKGKEVARVPIPEGGSVEVRPDCKPPDVPGVEVVPGASPFDAMRREQIPPEELKAARNGDPARAPQELVAVLGDSALKHPSIVSCVAYSPDGAQLASVEF